MTAATHVCVLCMRYCNGITAYILLHYLMKFHLEMTKDKEMTAFLYILSDHPSYYPCIAKKALISFAVTVKLICVFVFAYANYWFSQDAANMLILVTIQLALMFDKARCSRVHLYTKALKMMIIYEPVREKTNNLGSDQVRHKPACTVTE